MSTLSTTNLKNPSAPGNNIILNADGTISGSALADVSDVNGINTTGSVTSGSASLTVASATGIVAGMFVVGEGIAPGTTVSTIVSTTVTLSANAGATLSSDPVTFYSATKVLSPGVVGSQLCRAWVNFNGTSTVAIRAAYNVSSITDNGTGDYTVNFTTALADANYNFTFGAQGGIPGQYSVTSPTASALRVITFQRSDGNLIDSAFVCVAIFR